MKDIKMDNVNGIEFESINEFLNYIQTQPRNYVFSNAKREMGSDQYHTDNWAGTRNFTQAMNLLKGGWKEGTDKLVSALKINNMEIGKTSKQFYDMSGFQCSVPRYLQGIPTNMINSKKVPSKQRVVTINKSISYNAGFEPDDILMESKKAVQIVQKIEAQGIRTNLNVIFASKDRITDRVIFVKIRIKSSGERINLAKISFPLMHPSMLRRIILKYLEVFPPVTKYFTKAYGKPIKDKEIKSLGIIGSNEVLIPIVFDKDINLINSVEDLI